MDKYFITNEKPDIGTVSPLTQYGKRWGMKWSSDRYCIFCISENTTVCNMRIYLFAITEHITETVGHKSRKKYGLPMENAENYTTQLILENGRIHHDQHLMSPMPLFCNFAYCLSHSHENRSSSLWNFNFADGYK